MPEWLYVLVDFIWNKQLTYNKVAQFFGRSWTLDNLSKMPYSEDSRGVMNDFIFHLTMRKATSEHALFILFNTCIMAKLPLGSVDRLGNPDFEVPIVFVMGEKDWVKFLDLDDEL